MATSDSAPQLNKRARRRILRPLQEALIHAPKLQGEGGTFAGSSLLPSNYKLETVSNSD